MYAIWVGLLLFKQLRSQTVSVMVSNQKRQPWQKTVLVLGFQQMLGKMLDAMKDESRKWPVSSVMMYSNGGQH